MDLELKRTNVIMATLAMAGLALMVCNGCSSHSSANKGAVLVQVPTAAQQAMVIQTIQNNPNIPPEAKTSAINSFKQQVLEKEEKAQSAVVKVGQ